MSYNQETAEQRERRKLSLFTTPLNKYGYQLNVNNPVINALYEDYIKRYGILRPPSDTQRTLFEKSLWNFLRRLYRKYDPKAPDVPPLPKDGHISAEFFGWRREQFEIFVNNVLDVPKTVELFRRVKIKIEEDNSNDEKS
ncbi:MAG: hypothetical protein J6C96_12595 [Oscillospiraceae bacterium]|nr:hypothetical protein [Oscillospiraceae bacterium]